jgi:hypothetical protein
VGRASCGYLAEVDSAIALTTPKARPAAVRPAIAKRETSTSKHAHRILSRARQCLGKHAEIFWLERLASARTRLPSREIVRLSRGDVIELTQTLESSNVG